MIDPLLIAQLLTLIVQLLLQLFGGDHAKVASYLTGADIPWYRVGRKWARAAEIRGLIIAKWHGPADQLEQAAKQVVAEFNDASPGSVKTWAVPTF